MMSHNAASSHLLNLEHLLLEIPESAYALPSHAYSTSGALRRAHLNQMALESFLPWVRAEQDQPARLARQSATWPSIWEFVNGTALTVGAQRLVLVPSEAIDGDELRVAQEWVDLPNWVADYYVAVYVNPDEGYVQVQGYTTHRQLKERGTYDAGDRAYTLSTDDLIPDLNVLWVAQDLGLQTVPQATVAPLAPLPLEQAQALIERLGNPAVVFPRQAVPFPLWGALLAHDGWRKRLYEQRQGMVEQWSLAQWLRAGISGMAAEFGWAKPQLQLATGLGTRSAEVGVCRMLEIEGQAYTLKIGPSPESTGLETPVWRFELAPVDGTQQIPVGMKLRLLTEDLQTFDNNEDGAIAPVATLYVDVMAAPGEGIVWAVEPTPEAYEPEVLRF